MWLFSMFYLHFLVMLEHDMNAVVHCIQHALFGTPATHDAKEREREFLLFYLAEVK